MHMRSEPPSLFPPPGYTPATSTKSPRYTLGLLGQSGHDPVALHRPRSIIEPHKVSTCLTPPAATLQTTVLCTGPRGGGPGETPQRCTGGSTTSIRIYGTYSVQWSRTLSPLYLPSPSRTARWSWHRSGQGGGRRPCMDGSRNEIGAGRPASMRFFGGPGIVRGPWVPGEWRLRDTDPGW